MAWCRRDANLAGEPAGAATTSVIDPQAVADVC